MSDLKTRLISALVLGPLVLAVAWWGGLPYSALVCVAALAFLWEWFTMTGTRGLTVCSTLGYSGIVGTCLLFNSGLADYAYGLVVLAAAAVWAVGRGQRAARWGAEGVFYAALAAISLLALRATQNGSVILFFVLIVVWATDICAYFVGRFVGGPKLWRRVSPNKTWSGALGGLGFAVVFSGLFVLAIGQQGLFYWAGLAAVLSAVSQIGDLMESAIKRRFEVKDSSGLIPGHGGVMDRIDGLVAAAIAAVLLGLAMGGSLADPISGLGLI